MTHDELARSLADHLRSPDRMTWCDIQLGAAGSVRPDVYTIMKSFVRPTPMAYECKVSVGDFLGDVTSGKWQAYLKFACGVYFAVPAGLIAKEHVPEHCGLIVLHGSWRVAKRPILQPVTIPQNALLKLLIDGVQREGPRYRAKAWNESQYTEQFKRRFGEVAARTVRDRLAVEREIEDRRHQAQRILDDAMRRAEAIRKEASDRVAPLRTELCEVLSLPASASQWEIEQAVATLRAALAQHPAHRKLQTLTRALQNVLERDGWKEEEGNRGGEDSP